MLRPRLLQMLIEHGRRRRDEAAGVSAQAQRASRQAQQVLGTLQEYRRDYDRKAPKARLTTVDPRLLPRHERFVERLDVAVQDQTHQLERLQFDAEQRRRQLMAAERRVKAFETLRERQVAARARRQERREQFETDELAARLARSTPTPGER
ncbi:MAG TPA: flagellar export protein FliJ [Burkholderiaceae bacterium]|nr:flagellar export protein FliJ [Burkholderiaceae bacterium]